MEFREFELQIGPRSGDGFLLRVLTSPAGQAEGVLELPPIAHGVRPAHDRTRGLALLARGTPVGGIDPREIGGELFRALFSGAIGALFHRSLSWIDHESGTRGLRIRLRMNPRDRSLASLWSVPWELLYREETDDFLALSRLTPIVRALDIPRPVPSEPTAKPLRILLVNAPDPETGDLDLGTEVAELGAILGRDRDIDVEVLDHPDSHSLRQALERGAFHVLHYMGHGVFEPSTGEGALLFIDPSGSREVVSARHLATKLKDFPSLRLVVLNACDTAKSSNTTGHDPFAGVATALVLAGIPAVVAMQTPIEDACAIAFSVAFYERLVRGLGVDEALSEGRQALYSLTSGGIDWAIPVLFLRAPSGDLFAWKGTPPQARAAPEPAPRHRQRAVLGAAGLVVLGGALGVGLWLRPSAPREAEPGAIAATSSPGAVLSASPALPTRVEPPRAEIVEGGSRLRFDVRGAKPSFLEALRRVARRLGSSAEFGGVDRRVYVELSRPTTSEQADAGTVWRVCRMSATCRVESAGRLADLGSVSVARTHLDATVACGEASAALAEAVVDKLVGYVREALP